MFDLIIKIFGYGFWIHTLRSLSFNSFLSDFSKMTFMGVNILTEIFKLPFLNHSLWSHTFYFMVLLQILFVFIGISVKNIDFLFLYILSINPLSTEFFTVFGQAVTQGRRVPSLGPRTIKRSNLHVQYIVQWHWKG